MLIPRVRDTRGRQKIGPALLAVVCLKAGPGDQVVPPYGMIYRQHATNSKYHQRAGGATARSIKKSWRCVSHLLNIIIGWGQSQAGGVDPTQKPCTHARMHLRNNSHVICERISSQTLRSWWFSSALRARRQNAPTQLPIQQTTTFLIFGVRDCLPTQQPDSGHDGKGPGLSFYQERNRDVEGGKGGLTHCGRRYRWWPPGI